MIRALTEALSVAAEFSHALAGYLRSLRCVLYRGGHLVYRDDEYVDRWRAGGVEITQRQCQLCREMVQTRCLVEDPDGEDEHVH